MALTTDLGHGVHAVDTAMHGYHGITAGYLIVGERPCLVETGTARSAPTVIEALASLGVDAADLATVVVTHIHLDHAGGVGDIAAHFPNAEIVVHERGARHLVDPERLMRSARMVYGSALDDLFGPLLPTDQERVTVLGERGSIDLGGGRRLDSFYSPGHAQHHIGLLDSHTGDLYVGDAAGIYVPDADVLRPGTPPPDFNLDLALASLDTFSALTPNRLLFSHFGPVDDPLVNLERAREEMRLWVELVRESRADGLDLDHAVAMVRERTRERYAAFLADPALEAKFEELNATATNIVGINRWLDSLEAAAQG